MLFALLALPLLLSLAGLWRWAWLPVVGALALPLLGDVAKMAITEEVLPGMNLGLRIQTEAEVGKMVVLLWVYLAVHLYSLFYFEKGALGRPRYFGLLGLFLFGMATLMAASSWLAILLGWETIGLASFGLVSFYRKEEAVSKQASYVFWVNRLGDVSLLLGIALALAASPWAIYALVGAAVVKSAQLPFSIWLPWAMVGPTPVSALLHAATLVVSGVVLLTHPLVHPLLAQEPQLCQFLTLWAALTALVCAFEACRATNLKRLLAYSTLAHVALMMLWPYVQGGTASLWHLGTHAFFKTGLFLAVGLLHSYDHVPPIPVSQLTSKLRKNPWAITAAIVALFFTGALVGLPVFTSHTSKSAILYANPGTAFWIHPWVMKGRVLFQVVYIALTAIYASRFLFGYWQALAQEQLASKAIRGQVLVLVGLVPFLFWQPFRGMPHPSMNAYPSPLFLDGILFLALLLTVWFMLSGRKSLVPASLVTDNFWGKASGLLVTILQGTSQTVSRFDTAWAKAPLGIARAHVVLAWLLEHLEKAVILVIRFTSKVVVLPLRWLVDDEGHLAPSRMVWTAVATALFLGYFIL